MEELVDTLSDEDLYYRLKEFKPELGPVVDSTRSLYKRLLLKALQGDLTATSILNSSKESTRSPQGSSSGPITRSQTTPTEDGNEGGETTEEEDDQETEEEAMDVADDEFEILDNRELDGEDQYFQRQALITDNGESNSFLIKTVVVGLIIAALAIIIVAVWMPPVKKV